LAGISWSLPTSTAGWVAAVAVTLARRFRAELSHALCGESDAGHPEELVGWVKALLHFVYDQPDAGAVDAQFDRIVDALVDKFPAVATPERRAPVDQAPARAAAPFGEAGFERRILCSACVGRFRDRQRSPRASGSRVPAPPHAGARAAQRVLLAAQHPDK